MIRPPICITLFAALTIAVTAAYAQETPESPLTVDGATTVNAQQAKKLYDRGVPFVDVRTSELWEAGHIPGAHLLELLNAFDEASLLKIGAKDSALVIYCAGPVCKRSSKACAKAVAWGFQDVYYFRGGFPEWQAAGYATDPP
ncbi:MAG: rhodanese-like domain-containing protein [Acidiferrobacterales bacterium]